MFVPSGSFADRVHLGAEPLERARREARVRAVRAVERDPQPAQVGAEVREHVLEVAVGRRRPSRPTSPGSARGGRVEQRLDLLLGRVGQLAPARVEELDAVVLGRVVRGRDDDAEVERARARRPASAARRRAPRSRRPRRRRARTPASSSGPEPRVSRPTKTRSRAAPERRRPAEPLDELRRQELADDPANAVRAEVPTRHGRSLRRAVRPPECVRVAHASHAAPTGPSSGKAQLTA